MGNEIQIFNNPQFGEIRTAGTADNPMFCLGDLCRVLDIANVTDARGRLKEDGLGQIEVIDKIGRKQMMYFVNEQNLYKLIMRSDKPQAEPFQDWVCGEVLPSIRKTGTYSIEKLSRKQLALMVVQAEEEKERLQLENKQQQIEITSLTSKTEMQAETIRAQSKELTESREKVQKYDSTMSTNGLFTTTKIADSFGISAKKLNKILEILKIQYRQSGCYHLYSEYKTWKGQNLAKIIPNPYFRQDGSQGSRDGLYWTVYGREFLLVDKANKIKELIPVIKV